MEQPLHEIDHEPLPDSHSRHENRAGPHELRETRVHQCRGKNNVSPILAEIQLLHPLVIGKPGKGLDARLQIRKRQGADTVPLVQGRSQTRQRLYVSAGCDVTRRRAHAMVCGNVERVDVLREQARESARFVTRAGQLLQKPHGTHRMRIAPEDASVVGERHFDAPAPQLHEKPRLLAERDPVLHGQIHQPRLFAAGDDLHLESGLFLGHAKERLLVAALPNGARRHRRADARPELVDAPPEAFETFHCREERFVGELSGMEDVVPQAQRLPAGVQDHEALGVGELSHAETKGVRADVYGSNPQRKFRELRGFVEPAHKVRIHHPAYGVTSKPLL